ncbi:hypothetical protein [Microbispora sp. KK1-11]|uniref:hypothetical protein n=1 Tax=Microbispora sp. KK1-11 TaxID=2053005 RepID=UPI001157FCAD|nr:hypothetical protein [Microbispora sp. KK1-11]TQS30026.1 hypothetical protein FLW16_06610 [Microbispora sp. KK1-11]
MMVELVALCGLVVVNAATLWVMRAIIRQGRELSQRWDQAAARWAYAAQQWEQAARAWERAGRSGRDRQR